MKGFRDRAVHFGEMIDHFVPQARLRQQWIFEVAAHDGVHDHHRWVGGVVDRIGAKLITVVGIILCAVATVPFAFATAHTSYLLLGAALVVRGGALSAVNIAISTGAFTGLSRQQIPAGSAVVRLVQQLGGSAGTALLATVVAGFALSAHPLIGYHAAFLWSIGLTLVDAIEDLSPRPHEMGEFVGSPAASAFAVDVGAVRKIVANDPGRTAQVIKEWISSGVPGSQQR